MQRSLSILAAAFLLAAADPAPALTIDFEEFDHGDIVALNSASHAGYTLTVDRLKQRFDAAVAFDTGVSGSLEPDLEQGTGYEYGNLPPLAGLGNILVIQGNDDCDTAALFCRNPEDWGRRPAGTFLFEFDDSFETFAFDLVDVDDATRENGGIDFYLLGVEVASFAFSDFTAGAFAPQGVEYGNHSANHIDLGQLGVYDAIRFRMGGSGGIDNLETGSPVPVPEPGTAALLWLGLAALVAGGRGRRI